MQLRRIIELLSPGKKFKRRMPAPFEQVSIIVSPDAQLKDLKSGAKGLDAMFLGIAVEEAKPNMQVWDVGAKVGVFSVDAAAKGAVVTAFEPDLLLANLIKSTGLLPQNRGLRLGIVAGAIGDRDGFPNSSSRSAAVLATRLRRGARDRFWQKMCRREWLSLGAPRALWEVGVTRYSRVREAAPPHGYLTKEECARWLP